MKIAIWLGLMASLSGCMVERIGPPGVVLTRPVRVSPRDVRVFASAAMVPGPYRVVDEVFVKDDGDSQPRVLERHLRELAGARGANAIILDPMNRTPNGLRVDLRPTLDRPFEYFRARAIWLGAGPRPETYLGTLGGAK